MNIVATFQALGVNGVVTGQVIRGTISGMGPQGPAIPLVQTVRPVGQASATAAPSEAATAAALAANRLITGDDGRLWTLAATAAGKAVLRRVVSLLCILSVMSVLSVSQATAATEDEELISVDPDTRETDQAVDFRGSILVPTPTSTGQAANAIYAQQQAAAAQAAAIAAAAADATSKANAAETAAKAASDPAGTAAGLVAGYSPTSHTHASAPALASPGTEGMVWTTTSSNGSQGWSVPAAIYQVTSDDSISTGGIGSNVDGLQYPLLVLEESTTWSSTNSHHLLYRNYKSVAYPYPTGYMSITEANTQDRPFIWYGSDTYWYITKGAVYTVGTLPADYLKGNTTGIYGFTATYTGYGAYSGKQWKAVASTLMGSNFEALSGSDNTTIPTNIEFARKYIYIPNNASRIIVRTCLSNGATLKYRFFIGDSATGVYTPLGSLYPQTVPTNETVIDIPATHKGKFCRLIGTCFRQDVETIEGYMWNRFNFVQLEVR